MIMTNPLPESAVELAARLMCEADNGRSPPHAYLDMARAALPAIREAVVGEYRELVEAAKAVKAARYAQYDSERNDAMADLSAALAALTEQENRNDQERSHDGG